ncbi:MAG: hypothetical protein H8D56_08540 [Planctomycetes bacterium]|nr:hypothetical protein [Planctomycetota bacterium]
MQNKPNFRNDKMNINSFITSKYKIFSAGSGQKTKPIQTQFNPKQTQFNPKQTQTNPIKANNQSSLIINHLKGPELSTGKKLDIWDDLVDKLISDLGKNLSDFI